MENQKNITTSSLTDILNSINSEDNIKVNTSNHTDDNDDNNDNNNEINRTNLDNKTNFDDKVHISISKQIQLLSNDIDRRIGNYLLDELEKKQIYIQELEEALKFQEKEITELKQKFDAINKLELLSKIKSNIDTKTIEPNTNDSINSTEVSSIDNKKLKKNQQVHVPAQAPMQTDKMNDQYPKNNPDLVLRKDTGLKTKSITKEEEEPRYNGIMMLDKPKKEEEIKIQLDYETETSDMDLIKQRRRKARF